MQQTKNEKSAGLTTDDISDSHVLLNDRQHGPYLGSHLHHPLSKPMLSRSIPPEMITMESIPPFNHYYQPSADTSQAIIFSMATLAEYYDGNIGNHLCRIRDFMKLLCQQLQKHSHYQAILTPANQLLIYHAALLHDIGKMRVPLDLNIKSGALSSEEFETMVQHAVWGKDALELAEHHCGLDSKLLHFAKEIAYSHHERWNGSGYPQGLKGNEIPVSARLMALADVYDGLITPKSYKPAMSHADTVEIIRESRDNLFDPVVVDAFLETECEFKMIAAHYPIIS